MEPKREYVSPEFQITVFAAEDVITTSGDGETYKSDGIWNKLSDFWD